MIRYFSFAMVPLISLLLTACSTTQGEEENEETEGMAEAPRRASLPSFNSPGVTRGRLEGLDFGDATWEVPDRERSKIKAVATYLKVNAERVIVAGGAQVTSPEYARQLGQQRALAVKAALIKEGIPANKIVTVSYGGDLPGKGGDRVEFGMVPTGEKPL
jgi:peptidoglycan-associated lipoprotein